MTLAPEFVSARARESAVEIFGMQVQAPRLPLRRRRELLRRFASVPAP